ncbi:hypothetical protein HOY80DRAFT_939609 [Tuber brumale]|nr:hypothetical protein HOY80DRAFT_939609 [Tuber brumale]
MKLSSVALIASIVAAVSAQTLADLPQCALACITNGFPSTGCIPTDLNCACSNNQFVSNSTACVRDSCPPADSLSKS